ncbi:hypothetical protein INR49_021258 [Caranx melampygus]|nr:hypothetical protein INR49_021258 [Caranx melampygus]
MGILLLSLILKMIMKAQKRKFPMEDVEISDRSSPTWESQRQFVFSVSLSKYQRGQELPEPSLRRSVLIANTLRQISLEACRSPTVDMEVSPFSPSPIQEEEHETAISSILTALDSTIDGSPQVAPRTPLRSLENLSRPEGSVTWVKPEVRGYGGGWEQQEECRVRESNMEVMRSSYLSDLTVEDLFQDIDTSLLERDMGVLGLRGSGAGYPAAGQLQEGGQAVQVSHFVEGAQQENKEDKAETHETVGLVWFCASAQRQLRLTSSSAGMELCVTPPTGLSVHKGNENSEEHYRKNDQDSSTALNTAAGAMKKHSTTRISSNMKWTTVAGRGSIPERCRRPTGARTRGYISLWTQAVSTSMVKGTPIRA